MRQDLGVGRHEQDVVEGERFLEDTQHDRPLGGRKEAGHSTCAPGDGKPTWATGTGRDPYSTAMSRIDVGPH